MYNNFEHNEYHHLVIKEITDNSYQDYPYIIINGYGYIFYRNLDSSTGISKDSYSVSIKVEGDLMGYVQNELTEGDRIFVIGHSTTLKRKGFSIRGTYAECIYKEEWQNYLRKN